MKNQNEHTLHIHPAYPLIGNDEALQLILNNLDDIFFLIDRDLRIQVTTVYTTGKIKKLLGKELTPGMCILALVPAERHSYLREIYSSVFEGHDARSELEVPTPDGTAIIETHYKPARNP